MGFLVISWVSRPRDTPRCTRCALDQNPFPNTVQASQTPQCGVRGALPRTLGKCKTGMEGQAFQVREFSAHQGVVLDLAPQRDPRLLMLCHTAMPSGCTILSLKFMLRRELCGTALHVLCCCRFLL